MKKCTMKDIAEEAGVSITTVSKIFNKIDMHISEATRKRVLDIAERRMYVPNGIAKGLRQNKSNTIGIITMDITDPFYAVIVRGIEAKCKERGVGALICNTDGDRDTEFNDYKYLASKMVDGIILVRSLALNSIEPYIASEIPIVVIDKYIDISKLDNIGKVTSDADEAVGLATRVLLDAGCRAIGYIGPSRELKYSARYAGYVQCLHEAGIPIDEALVYHGGPFQPETGMAGVHKIFQHRRPDGIVAGNDLIAAGILMELRKMGIDVPGEVKVIGVDDIYLSALLTPPLTTVNLNNYEMGYQSAEMLLANVYDGVPLSTKLLDCKVIMRESV